jgi:hypothetical protein
MAVHNTLSNSSSAQRKKTSQPPRLIPQLTVGLTAGLLTLIVLIWFTFPVGEMTTMWIANRYTPTPIPPTHTPLPTSTQTAVPSPTIQPTPSITPLPASAFIVQDANIVFPEIPSLSQNVIILNDDKNVIVNPDFSNIQWYPSSQIAGDLGREIPEPYYATFGPGNATWIMDVPLTPGIYEIYILDTLFSSGGSLDFTVYLGGNPIPPILGEARVEYESSQGNPPQASDLWRSIGVYSIDNIDILSVVTSWDVRNQLTIVAIDRVLMAQLPDSTFQILEPLPSDQKKFVVDESVAEFESSQYWETRYDSTAWGDQYQVMVNPPIETSITWSLPYTAPVTRYEIRAWIPSVKGEVETSYRLFASGYEIYPENGEDAITVTQAQNQDAQWVSLGFWSIPEIHGTAVSLNLQMGITSNSNGEVGVDAIAFIISP